MGLSSSRGSTGKWESAVCAVCLSVVTDLNIPKLDCQHRLCLRCMRRFSGKTIRKGQRYPQLSQCPVCSEIALFPDSSTNVSTTEQDDDSKDDKENQHILVSLSKSHSGKSSSKQSPSSPSRKRQLQDDSDDEFIDTVESSVERAVIEDGPAHILCSNCQNHKPKRKKTVGTVYCFDCTTVLCSSCKENHDLRPRCKAHVLCSVNEDTIKDLLCDFHQQLAEDYCIDCKSVTCAECHVSDHRGHNIREFTVCDLDQSIFKELELYQTKNQNALDSINAMENVYQTELQNTRDAIEKSRKEVLELVNCHFNSMTNTLDAKESKVKERFSKARRSVEKEDDIVKELLARSHQLVTPIQSIPDLHIRNADDLLDDLRKKIPHSSHDLDQPSNFVYIPVENIKTNFGQLIEVPLSEFGKCIEVD